MTMVRHDLIAWFSSQSIWTQVFFGLFVVFIAIPIATLIVLQFIESVRSTRESARIYGKAPRQDEKGE
jgi:hypothetical protein